MMNWVFTLVAFLSLLQTSLVYAGDAGDPSAPTPTTEPQSLPWAFTPPSTGTSPDIIDAAIYNSFKSDQNTGRQVTSYSCSCGVYKPVDPAYNMCGMFGNCPYFPRLSVTAHYSDGTVQEIAIFDESSTDSCNQDAQVTADCSWQAPPATTMSTAGLASRVVATTASAGSPAVNVASSAKIVSERKVLDKLLGANEVSTLTDAQVGEKYSAAMTSAAAAN
jgi:hypothetical protein